jgi:leucyl aminopeptidase
MIFNIKTKTSNEISKIPVNSAEIIFCKNNSEFDKIIKTKKISISNLQKNNFKDDENSELTVWNKDNPNLVLVKKTEINKKFNVDYFRNYLAGLVPTLKKEKITNLFIQVPRYSPYRSVFKEEEYFYQTIVEGILLGNYNFNLYKSEKSKIQSLTANFVADDKKIFESARKNAEAIIGGVFFSRDLVNEPANTLTPLEFAKRVKTQFRNTDVSVKVFNEKELLKRKMTAILSVGEASTNKPQLIIAHYKPKGKVTKKIALVGKGVTYDTGGLSIKPTSGMLEMKADMAGGATVFGIIKSAALRNLPIELIGIVPAVENAISGNAYKPGDIIATASGKTIEVKDTDAEGRIVLADALEYASKQKPDEIIDFATLTGAVCVSLGLFAAGIFTKNDRMCKDIIDASENTYEHAWRLPFWDEYNKLIESQIADVSNLGSKWGGAITAGKFLEHFVDEKIPWTHIDLAGPALQHDLTNYTKDYCTGYGVRLMSRYLELSR